MRERRGATLRDALEDEILSGGLRPGTPLDETRLAARFGVSRTPIREALVQLAASDLVELRPRRTALVRGIGPKRLIEMFDVMAELEAACARLAARRADAEASGQIEIALIACTEAADAQDPDGYYYENELFHEAVDLAGRNVFLSEHTRALRKRLKPYRRLQLRVPGRVSQSLAEHQAVTRAILARDPAAAGAAMRAHVVIQGERFSDLVALLEPMSSTD